MIVLDQKIGEGAVVAHFGRDRVVVQLTAIPIIGVSWGGSSDDDEGIVCSREKGKEGITEETGSEDASATMEE